jgi:hypothetical protein
MSLAHFQLVKLPDFHVSFKQRLLLARRISIVTEKSDPEEKASDGRHIQTDPAFRLATEHP